MSDHELICIESILEELGNLDKFLSKIRVIEYIRDRVLEEYKEQAMTSQLTPVMNTQETYLGPKPYPVTRKD